MAWLIRENINVRPYDWHPTSTLETKRRNEQEIHKKMNKSQTIICAKIAEISIVVPQISTSNRGAGLIFAPMQGCIYTYVLIRFIKAC